MILYIFGPVIRYVVCSELVLAVMNTFWSIRLEKIVLQSADTAYTHSFRTVWSVLCILIPAGAGCLFVRRDARIERQAFPGAQRKRRSVYGQKNGWKLFYAAAEERVRLRAMPVLLTSSLFMTCGINVLITCLLPDPGSAAAAGALPGAAGILLQALLYCFFMPYVEETIFRGILYPRLRRFYGTSAAVLLSAAFFGLYHGRLAQGIYASIMGILFAAAYEAFGDFAVPLALHGAGNLIILCLQWTDSYHSVCTPAWGAAFLGIAAGGFLTIFIMLKKTAE